jgi:hypothetical protein
MAAFIFDASGIVKRPWHSSMMLFHLIPSATL